MQSVIKEMRTNAWWLNTLTRKCLFPLKKKDAILYILIGVHMEWAAEFSIGLKFKKRTLFH
jgi:hypothetical protein